MSINPFPVRAGAGGPQNKDNLFLCGVPDIRLNDLGFPNAYEISITESIDRPYRIGKIKIFDIIGLQEFTSLYTTTGNDVLTVNIRNNLEDGVGRPMRFGLYNSTQQPTGEFHEKRERVLTYDIIEQPIYSNIHLKALTKSYRGKTASGILEDILRNDVKIQNLKVVKGDNDPIIPTFIIPFWTARKTLDYLSNYISQGPYKLFPNTEDGYTTYKLFPLQKVIKGEVFGCKLNAFVTATSSIKEGNKIKGNFKITGPSHESVLNNISGESQIVFDYFVTNPTEFTERSDFVKNSQAKYDFEDGDSKFKTDGRQYASNIGGIYEEGSKKSKSKSIGKYSPYLNKDINEVRNDLIIDVETKKICQTKMRNRFYQSFHENFVLQAIMPAHRGLNVGQIFDISIPSSDQSSDKNMNKDETLSGDWLLYKMEHVIKSPSRMQYEIIATFIRTGLETSNKTPNQIFT